MTNWTDNLTARLESVADRFRRYRRPLQRAHQAMQGGRWRSACLELENAHNAVMSSHAERDDLLGAIEASYFTAALFSQDDAYTKNAVAMMRSLPASRRPRALQSLTEAAALADDLVETRRFVAAATFGRVLQHFFVESMLRDYLSGRMVGALALHQHRINASAEAIAQPSSEAEIFLRSAERKANEPQNSLIRVVRAWLVASVREPRTVALSDARSILEPVKPWRLPDYARLVYGSLQLESPRRMRRVRALDGLAPPISPAYAAPAQDLLERHLAVPVRDPGTIEIDRLRGAFESRTDARGAVVIGLLDRWEQYNALDNAQSNASEQRWLDDYAGAWSQACSAFLDPEAEPIELDGVSGPVGWAIEALDLSRAFDIDRAKTLARTVLTALGQGQTLAVWPRGKALWHGPSVWRPMAALIPRIVEDQEGVESNPLLAHLVECYVTSAPRPTAWGFADLARLAASNELWTLAALCAVRELHDVSQGLTEDQEGWSQLAGEFVLRGAQAETQNCRAQRARQLLEMFRDAVRD